MNALETLVAGAIGQYASPEIIESDPGTWLTAPFNPTFVRTRILWILWADEIRFVVMIIPEDTICQDFDAPVLPDRKILRTEVKDARTFFPLIILEEKFNIPFDALLAKFMVPAPNGFNLIIDPGSALEKEMVLIDFEIEENRNTKPISHDRGIWIHNNALAPR